MKFFAPVMSLLVVAALPAQEPPAPLVFGSDVDVVSVDVSVVDRNGHPAYGLQPEDFELSVGKQPRRIISVQFLSQETSSEQERRTPPTHYSSNEDVPRGRLVVIAIDQANIQAGGARGVAAAAGKLLDHLGSVDRVGLMAFPRPGPAVDFTGDFNKVRMALRHVVGRARLTSPQISLTEALGFMENDPFGWEQVVQRECGTIGASLNNPTDIETCSLNLESEAFRLVTTFRNQSKRSISSLRALFQGLQDVEGPKTVILISEGLTSESPLDYRDLALDAAAARVSLYVLRLEGGLDATVSRVRQDPEDDLLRTDGLIALAAGARGTVFAVSGTGESVFKRIARELSGFYILGFEPRGSDRDGHAHDIRVRVKRPGLTVRARRSVSFRPGPLTADRSRELIRSVLRAPFPAVDLPVRVATYAAPAPSPDEVRVLIHAEVGRDTGAVADLTVGYILLDGAGQVAASGARALTAPPTGPGGAKVFRHSVTLKPGYYTLKFAALDRRGRRGRVDHALKAALIEARGAAIGDLLLSTPPVRPGDAILPVIPVIPVIDAEVTGGSLLAYLEMRSGPGENLDVAFQVAASEHGQALLSGVAQSTPLPSQPGAGADAGADADADALAGDTGGRRQAQASLSVSLLPPGEYVARAVVSRAGKAIAQTSRPFWVRPRGDVPTVSVGEPPRGISLAGLAPSIDRFRTEQALSPEVLTPFLDRLEHAVGERLSGTLGEALERTREGRFQDVVRLLGPAQTDSLPLTFLRGIGFLAGRNVPAAATQFRASLRHSSEFFPAAFYLGACYAAQGLDLQAAGAWQTTLIVENDVAAVYRLLGDALLRADQPEVAEEVLVEARDKWPEQESFRRSLGIAYAMRGKEALALASLEQHLDKRPDDTGALFVTLRLLFDAYQGGRQPDPFAGDRVRFTRYARAYMEAKGPQRELVGAWLDYLREANR